MQVRDARSVWPPGVRRAYSSAGFGLTITKWTCPSCQSVGIEDEVTGLFVQFRCLRCGTHLTSTDPPTPVMPGGPVRKVDIDFYRVRSRCSLHRVFDRVDVRARCVLWCEVPWRSGRRGLDECQRGRHVLWVFTPNPCVEAQITADWSDEHSCSRPEESAHLPRCAVQSDV